jgi:hypothetical protein
MANCAGTGVCVQRAAGWEKWFQSPAPNAKPSTTNPASTVTFSSVSAFCTRAVRCTPTQFNSVNIATSVQAASCAPPNRKVQSPDPANACAFSCFSAGKK